MGAGECERRFQDRYTKAISLVFYSEFADLMWDAGNQSPAFFNFQKFLTRKPFIRNLISISKNALKLTYSKVECQKISRGRNPRTPAPREAASNAAGEGSV